MAIFAISDLHLACSVDKPMDVFGEAWSNYMQRIKSNWETTVQSEDYVIIPGDVSWAMYLEQMMDDFRFIEALPGKKIISKGNHDYWWNTLSKMNKFLQGHGFNTIRFMHNNSFNIEGFALCGCRGWKYPGDADFSEEDKKIYERELHRLEFSLNSIPKEKSDRGIIVAMHYPPFGPGGEKTEFIEVMLKHGVAKCLYGHLHGKGFKNAVEGKVEGIEFRLVSADYLNFNPMRIFPGDTP